MKGLNIKKNAKEVCEQHCHSRLAEFEWSRVRLTLGAEYALIAQW